MTSLRALDLAEIRGGFAPLSEYPGMPYSLYVEDLDLFEAPRPLSMEDALWMTGVVVDI